MEPPFGGVPSLLVFSRPPTRSQLDQFDADLKASRHLPDNIIQVIRLVRNAHPMDVLRTAISALAAYDPDVADASPAANLRKAVRLIAQTPTIVATHHRIRGGHELLTPRDDLSHAANFLYMLLGREADREASRA